ncbi:MAG TPA: (2Fe-2S)-binding protein [Mycobacterium sp.]|nr:(2Fe-2S)-binding protein [Mycobacterium sp.]HTX98278.1 (2Fe-2S)-binding protein [Mycobacterium sp.]
MFVCLCNGVTSHNVAEAVAAGACTTNDVATACGAGADCGRCRRTFQAILRSSGTQRQPIRSKPR